MSAPKPKADVDTTSASDTALGRTASGAGESTNSGAKNRAD
jgi:hypothetical protein